MNIWTALSRAKRAFRDDWRLNAVAVASLVVAFLCVDATQLAVTNVGRIADRWNNSKQMTIYLQRAAETDDIEQLRLVLESLSEVETVAHVTSRQAREQFVKQAETGTELRSLPAEAFPASLEVGLRDGVSSARTSEVAERVKRLAAVEEVETYGEWFSGLSAVLRAAQWAAGVLALLVALCVVAVIGNTIRLAVANRRDEIEVLKLCGATDGFVRGPFVIEGALQGFAASLSAMVILLIAYAIFHGLVAPAYTVLTGVSPSFLHPLTALAVMMGGGVAGALGSLLSLRRYLVA